MSNNNIIGERIKELREQAKEKQWELAKEINISPAEICRYEKAKRKPGACAIIAIAKHYNVSADYLLGLTDKKIGKWIVKKDRFNSTIAVCSVCGAENRAGNFKYCFDCGAKMEGYE